MAWFSRRSKTLVPSDVLAQLNSFGTAAWEARRSSRPMNDPRLEWGSFFSKVHTAYQSSVTRTVAELHDAASSDPLARYGAYQVIAECEPGCQDPRYLKLMDAALEMMYTNRLSSGHMTRYEADRWIHTHGDLRTSFDRIVEVTPPAPGAGTLSLVPGQTVMVAVMGPGALDNQFWIECADASSYRAFSMRAKNSDATVLTRYEEKILGGFESADGILRAMGRYLGRPTYWALPELDPFFTERRMDS